MKKLFCIILLFLLLTTNVGQAQFNDTEPMFGQQLNLGHWSTDGLVFYWRGIPAGNVVDESYFGNHGTITGATWAGNGLDFTGSDFIDIGNEMFAGFSQFTVVMSVKLDTLPANGTFIGAWDSSDRRKILLRFSNVGALQFFTFTSAQVGGDVGITLPTDVWMQIAITYDGAIMIAYRDAVPGSTTYSQTGVLQSVTFNPVHIGNEVGGSGVGMDGQIRDVKIYDRALSASEIAALYINPDLPMQQPPIWLFYSPTVPSGIIPIIQAHNRRRAG